MFATIKRLLGYLKPFKMIFVLGVVLLAVASALELYSPMLAKRLIDDVMTPALKDDHLNVKLLILLLTGYLLINLCGGLLRYVALLNLRKMSNSIVKNFRDELFAHMHKLPVSFFDGIPAGKIVARITNDTEVLRSN